ncbi:IS21-like element helper ATPase IstB [Flavihumibacter rivuli]|uniref:IS21-like element helper ATPase IstB n=1 Tax=Flavihumibacter rivuli TaxID=2838156 RepID=UPI001BDDD057|nr:IS21-like element helper ATPase IstB [Flavihumibacter rivuli]ULQ55457.1 IS21-like element helper ATPase IstB [Flavihumibacter rivuli]ULQ55971.1 IS21-like element helper ATPase IstB [Flavihumibacter rivuli]
MNTTSTLEQMKELRLMGMAQTYQQQLELPLHQQLESHELVAHLLQHEQLYRRQEKTAYYLKLAKLRLQAIPEQINCSAARNLTKQQLTTLLEGQYLKNGDNILVTGATGCGKSYLACALGHQACLQGHKTIYLSMNRFIEKITLSKLDGTYLKLLNHLERQSLIILDDFGLQPMQQDIKLALLQILEERHGRRSTIVTSQLPVSAWYEYINEPTVADAIMDRLTASAHRIDLKGESLRRKK